MIKPFFLSLLLLACTVTAIAQVQQHTEAPYKRDPRIPAFHILQTDSTWFTREQLPKSAFTVIVYFSPDCGHCQHEVREMVKYMDSLKNVFFLWVSYRDMNDIKGFYYEYGLHKFPNIKMGRDPNYAIPSFYQVKTTPYVAVYDKKGLFIKSYEMGVEMPELLGLLKKHR